jgi:hypothetical protein
MALGDNWQNIIQMDKGREEKCNPVVGEQRA